MKTIIFVCFFFLAGSAHCASSFTVTARNEMDPLYRQMVQMAFNKELGDGTLAREKFDYYLAQDAVYLKEFSRALLQLAAKLEDPRQRAVALELAKEALEEASPSTSPLPPEKVMLPNILYTSYLLSLAAYHSAEELAAALLPCFQIYLEIGRELLAKSSPSNPYIAWLKSYSSEKYAVSVDKMKKLTDDLAKQASPAMRQKMLLAYLRASQLEWHFWEGAYALGRKF